VLNRGAGIGGLTLSSALDFFDVGRKLDVQIYEAATHISEIGAGINFWPRYWAIMKAIGLESELSQYLTKMPDDLPSELNLQ